MKLFLLAMFLFSFISVSLLADNKANFETAKKNAEQGDTEAQCILGSCYTFGEGVSKDEKKAVEWYTKSAEKGNAGAQCNLGMYYWSGQGVSKDEKKAVEWFTKSAEQGNAEAQCILGSCYRLGAGISKDEKKAVEWLTKSAEQGNAEAQCILGSCYRLGAGISKDEKKAVEWFTKSAEQGDAEAQCILGSCYRLGAGISKDEKKAFDWYAKSAEQGNATAQYFLGSCYGLGKGVSKDDRKAVEWITKSAEQGYELAKSMLANNEAGRIKANEVPVFDPTKPYEDGNKSAPNTSIGNPWDENYKEKVSTGKPWETAPANPSMLVMISQNAEVFYGWACFVLVIISIYLIRRMILKDKRLRKSLPQNSKINIPVRVVKVLSLLLIPVCAIALPNLFPTHREWELAGNLVEQMILSVLSCLIPWGYYYGIKLTIFPVISYFKGTDIKTEEEGRFFIICTSVIVLLVLAIVIMIISMENSHRSIRF